MILQNHDQDQIHWRRRSIEVAEEIEAAKTRKSQPSHTKKTANPRKRVINAPHLPDLVHQDQDQVIIAAEKIKIPRILRGPSLEMKNRREGADQLQKIGREREIARAKAKIIPKRAIILLVLNL